MQKQYVMNRRLELAAEYFENFAGDYTPAILLEGPPGCGKTAFGFFLSERLNARPLYYMLHEWSDVEELFSGVNVQAVVSGDIENVRQPGILALAAEYSLKEKVLLILDEVDKTSSRTEYLLYDFLQSGRVPVAPGIQLSANLSQLFVVMTTNNVRPLAEATLRRVRRVRLSNLDSDTMYKIVSDSNPAIPKSIITLVIRAAKTLGPADNAEISVQEISACAREICASAKSHADVKEILAAWLVRGENGIQMLERDRQLSAAIWAEASKRIPR
jgi:MoxR-like ATPase